jgi:hypothetical protein
MVIVKLLLKPGLAQRLVTTSFAKRLERFVIALSVPRKQRLAGLWQGINAIVKPDSLPLLAIQPLVEIGKVLVAGVLVLVAPDFVQRRR